MPNSIIYLIAISLSMDAFSLSLAYGTLNLEKSKIWKLSIIVGSYHFIMPIIGLLTGHYIYKIIPINPNIIVFIVLLIIGIQMIIESFKEEEIHILKKYEMIMFGLAVSIDSFTVGIGIKQITNNTFSTAIVFSITSSIFTYLGLYLGKIVNNKIGKISTIIGAIILILIGISYLK